MQTLIIGDVHGCFDELQALIEHAGLADGDDIVALGDIVDRGPDTPRVLEFFRSRANVRSLLGNHERKHVRSFRGKVRPALSQVISKAQLGEDYAEAVAFMETFPLFLDLPEALLVHGFYEPGVPLADQPETVLAGVMSGEFRLRKTLDRPWYELYDGPKPIVVGHRDYRSDGQPLIHADRVFAIDTGCVHGGALTGLILPGFRILSVPARENYWSRVRRSFAPAAKPARTPPVSEEDETVLAEILRRLAEEHERMLSELGFDPTPDPSDAEEKRRAKAYAAKVAGSPLAPWLFQARKKRLTLDSLRRHFIRRGSAAGLARLLGIKGD